MFSGIFVTKLFAVCNTKCYVLILVFAHVFFVYTYNCMILYLYLVYFSFVDACTYTRVKIQIIHIAIYKAHSPCTHTCTTCTLNKPGLDSKSEPSFQSMISTLHAIAASGLVSAAFSPDFWATGCTIAPILPLAIGDRVVNLQGSCCRSVA